jgi:aminomethyltransferase
MTDGDVYKQTVLFEKHMQLGARMAPFGGYMMPIQYAGILSEHKAARTAAAVFDTCHMGEFRVSGETALQDLENLLSCDLAELAVGRCRYGLMCNPEGGVIDDLVLYRLDDRQYMLVVNAGTQDGDFEWISYHVSEGTTVVNISCSTAKIDVQGPRAPRIVQSLTDAPIDGLKFYGFHHNTYREQPVLISRTGYTGEVGFEIYSDPATVGRIWDACIKLGAVAAGLGARDTLRLEIGMPLYGHELKEDRNAGTAGFGPFISKTKPFIGSTAILSNFNRKERMIGMEFEGRQAAREGNLIRSLEGNVIGVVTSGSFAPSLNHAVALGYVDSDFSAAGTYIEVEARRVLRAKVAEPPFYKEGTARRALADFLD